MGENKTMTQNIKKVGKWFNKKSITVLHLILSLIIIAIILTVFIFLGYLDPWSLLILFFGIIFFWFLLYTDKIAEELTFSSLDDKSFRPIDIISKVKEMIVLLNFLIDLHEIDYLNYIQLKERRFVIKVLKVLIYVLFLITFTLFILNPNLSTSSAYSAIRLLVTNILTLFFILYLKIERIKRVSSLFKDWISIAKKQILSITNLSVTKKIFKDISQELDDVNRRIDNYRLYFSPANQIINITEKVGYFLTIISILLPPILNSNILIHFFPYYVSTIILFIIYLIPYFYYSIVDRITFHRDTSIRLWKSELDTILKSIYSAYKKNLNESKE